MSYLSTTPFLYFSCTL